MQNLLVPSGLADFLVPRGILDKSNVIGIKRLSKNKSMMQNVLMGGLTNLLVLMTLFMLNLFAFYPFLFFLSLRKTFWLRG